MSCRLYLDNCSLNRPYDDQSFLKTYLESEAKLYVQAEILKGTFELAWSYVLDYEISFNPFPDRKTQIQKWKNIAKVDINVSDRVVKRGNEIMLKNIKPKDALHISCAIEAQCQYFITTDKKLLNKSVDAITIINPTVFIGLLGV
jgi:predicted nucleic acid-binding protein